MATAEIFTDASMAVTSIAKPLAGGVIQGSTQEYDVTASSQHSSAPVFFAPQHPDHEELAAYWGNLLPGVVRGFYTFVPSSRSCSEIGWASCVGSLSWDRLSLEVMRIGSLEPNWDGEGAEAVPPETVRSAAALLFLARTAMERSSGTLYSVPTVLPDVEGGIILNWVQEKKELKCTVFGEIVEVVRWRSPERYESDGLWEVPVQGVMEHFEWILQQ
jgi:hypothetical protein